MCPRPVIVELQPTEDQCRLQFQTAKAQVFIARCSEKKRQCTSGAPSRLGNEVAVCCCGLNMECASETQVWNVSSPTEDAIFRESRNFKKWKLFGGSELAGKCPWSLCCLMSGPGLPPLRLCFLSTMMTVFPSWPPTMMG